MSTNGPLYPVGATLVCPCGKRGTTAQVTGHRSRTKNPICGLVDHARIADPDGSDEYEDVRSEIAALELKASNAANAAKPSPRRGRDTEDDEDGPSGRTTMFDMEMASASPDGRVYPVARITVRVSPKVMDIYEAIQGEPWNFRGTFDDFINEAIPEFVETLPPPYTMILGAMRVAEQPLQVVGE